MSTQISTEKRDLMINITKKALEDASFKERLIANPVDAILEVYPEFPGGGDFKIEVVDQSAPRTTYLNISHLQYALIGGEAEELELSEQELEMVSGGLVADREEGFSCYFLSCW